ncbi:uncharacterized protein LOC126562996 [Anopheles maculipalpis]|uniref:uncharacterized protein LOC126562996 n=1 Tax=Anopheles maculipalpis TaxID=1496333 RepID=UPI002158D5A1|nr:uncharacterized protein LOC126562996 [Anopheles maculipalpis]
MFGALQNWWDKRCNRCNKFRWANCVQPERAASTEFAFTDYTNWTKETPPRHDSLPRRIFNNFRSERNEKDLLEEIALKRLLKEHGLYNKHQTIQQRRRLKYLLAVEQRANLLLCSEGRTQASMVHSPTCSIELHSMTIAPDHHVTTTSEQQCTSDAIPELRRGSSLSALATATSETNTRSDEMTISLPTIVHETVKDMVKDRCLKTVSWKTSASSAASTVLETAV